MLYRAFWIIINWKSIKLYTRPLSVVHESRSIFDQSEAFHILT